MTLYEETKRQAEKINQYWARYGIDANARVQGHAHDEFFEVISDVAQKVPLIKRSHEGIVVEGRPIGREDEFPIKRVVLRRPVLIATSPSLE